MFIAKSKCAAVGAGRTLLSTVGFRCSIRIIDKSERLKAAAAPQQRAAPARATGPPAGAQLQQQHASSKHEPDFGSNSLASTPAGERLGNAVKHALVCLFYECSIGMAGCSK